ncbi:4708_t:CDS:1, partial [Racocetra fulgida]
GILLISATDGMMDQTKEHLRLASRISIKHFINKVDAIKDPSLIELVEIEIYDYLTKFGFDEQKTPIIKRLAKCVLEGTKPEIRKKKIKELL